MDAMTKMAGSPLQCERMARARERKRTEALRTALLDLMQAFREEFDTHDGFYNADDAPSMEAARKALEE
jgi:hypothetical protein